jgi:hypothetical protein
MSPFRIASGERAIIVVLMVVVVMMMMIGRTVTQLLGL